MGIFKEVTSIRIRREEGWPGKVFSSSAIKITDINVSFLLSGTAINVIKDYVDCYSRAVD